MKQYVMKSVLLAGAAFCISSASFAQKESDKNAEVQQIIINRKGVNESEKTVIEINKDKITINGKNVDDIDNITVDINKLKDLEAYTMPHIRGRGRVNFELDDDVISLMSEDKSRPMLGVATDNHDKGVKITSVSKESAAEKAGLKPGDVILSIDGKQMKSPNDVAEAVREHKPGDKVALVFLRDGKEQKASAELGSWKGIRMMAENYRMMEPRLAPSSPMSPMPFQFRERIMMDRGPKMGLSIQDSKDGKGVNILDVEEGSNAAKAGLMKNDVITSVNDKDVKGVEDVAREVRTSMDKNNITFKVMRNGKSKTISVEVPRKLKTMDL